MESNQNILTVKVYDRVKTQLSPLLYLNDLEEFLVSKNSNGIEIAINDDQIKLYMTLIY